MPAPIQRPLGADLQESDESFADRLLTALEVLGEQLRDARTANRDLLEGFVGLAGLCALLSRTVNRRIEMLPDRALDAAFEHFAMRDLAPSRAALIAHVLRRYEIYLHCALDRRIDGMRATLAAEAASV